MGEVEGMDTAEDDTPLDTVDAVEAVETVEPETEPESEVVEDVLKMDDSVAVNEETDDKLVDSVLDNDVSPNDLALASNANINEKETSVTAQNMKKLIDENEKNKLKFNADDLLPKDVNNDWFETDFSNAQVGVDDSNLVVTDRYVVGVNTIGNSLKNPSYDIRAAPACPKFVVSPWGNSTIEPDFNIKSFE